MGSLEITCLDSERGSGCRFSMMTDGDSDEIICISEAEEGSFYSLSCSSHGQNFDSEVDHAVHSGRVSSVVGCDNDEIICFSKAEEGSCYSPSSSTTDSSNLGNKYDSDVDHVVHSRTVSSVAGFDCRIDIGNGVDEVKIFPGITEKDCRICKSSLDLECGIAVELGCCCKNDLAAVHQHCAETWFKIKGNKICEICNSIAKNIVITNIIESRQQIVGTNIIESRQQISAADEVSTVSLPPVPSSPNRECFACKVCLIALVLLVCFFIFLLVFNRVKISRTRY